LRRLPLMKIYGNEFNQRAIAQCLDNDIPVLLIGPAGCGKTVTALSMADNYAEETGAAVRYIQLSEENTKYDTILGITLKDGSCVIANGPVADAAERGDVLVVDEFTHATHELMLAFNSLTSDKITSVGGKTINAHPRFRLIACANGNHSIGNNSIPESVESRFMILKFDYLSNAEEWQLIADRLKCDGDANMTAIHKLAIEGRTSGLPISYRNIERAHMLISFLDTIPTNSRMRAIHRLTATLPTKDISDCVIVAFGLNNLTTHRNAKEKLLAVLVHEVN